MSVARGIPRQAVILVGGEGTRLRPVTSRVPKPVAPVVERPFVAYILDNLARHGVERAVFSTGFLAEAIEAVIGDGAGYGLEVDYAVEDEPLGTAGAIANCEDKLDDGSFYVFNGDVLSDVDLSALAAIAHRQGRHGHHLPHAGRGPAALRPGRAASRTAPSPASWRSPASGRARPSSTPACTSSSPRSSR